MNRLRRPGSFLFLMFFLLTLIGCGGSSDTSTYPLTIQKSGTGSGNVTSSPESVTCDSGCSTSFVEGTQVTLTATADDGSVFAGWSGTDCSGTGECTITMTGDITVTAIFNKGSAINKTNFLSSSGTVGNDNRREGAAEISAFDASSKRAFVVNVADAAIDIIDASTPGDPALIQQIALSSYGKAANSVAVFNGIVAVAVENENKQANGAVVFFGTDGSFLNSIEAGALPDMVIFTPDGQTVLAANEGEPNDDYSVDPEGSVTVISLANGVENATAVTADFLSFNSREDELKAAGVRIFGPNATVAQDVEPEYIAVSADSTTAWISLQENNAIAVLDIATATITQILPLGFKDHSLPGNGMDASNKDGIINIRNWPVMGMYMPDSITVFEADGKTYLVSANEGDSRDYDGFSEETRIKDLVLDETAFPNAAELQDEKALGRLKTTTTLGDTDGDGDVDKLYCYGGRSFSIWEVTTDSIKLVFDSGDAFERIIAERLPDYFNADDAEFDGRSDDKGPEPEGVTVGMVNGKRYAFVGLERMSGIVIYDITTPAAPVFIDYFSTVDFSQDAGSAAAGDISPEGLTFVSADNSPNGSAMLIVTSEVSGTTTFYTIQSEEAAAQEVTVQILHASDLEGGVEAIGRAPNFAAIADYFDDKYTNTLILSAGDNYISGPFNSAAGDSSLRTVFR